MLKRALVVASVIIIAAAYMLATSVIPSAAAGALVHPYRKPVHMSAPGGCADATFAGDGVTLRGWRCAAIGSRRGTLIFLHGIGDNRESVTGAVGRFTRRGFDVVAYDSRAQGGSNGDACTYGFWEQRDLRRVIDTLTPGPVILLGTSLGAAVAIQEAADDSRVVGIVSAEVFSDLNTVARERAPRLLMEFMIGHAFAIAESQGKFHVDAVSPVVAAGKIRVPVLVIHGTADTDTPPDHSQRVFAALAGPKELLLVPGAHHNESLRSPETWTRIDEWVDRSGGDLQLSR